MLEGEENPFADPITNRRGAAARGGLRAAPSATTSHVTSRGAANLPASGMSASAVVTTSHTTTRPTVAAFDRFVTNMSTSSAASSSSTTHATVPPHFVAHRFKDVKLEMLNKIEVSQEAVVNKVVLLPSSTREDGIICCGEDRTIRVYLRRESGIFWPSICTYASCPIGTLTFDAETRRIFCGLANGNIHEYLLAPDFNSLHMKKQITGTHSKRVVDLAFSLQCEWIVSIARDRLLAWHCSETGQHTGCVTLGEQPTCFCFDQATRHVFVGDESGAIVMLRLGERGEQQLVTKFSGHSASISALCWHPVAEMLFSGGNDKLIVAWDIGSKQGIVYELSGHTGRIVGLNYAVDESGLIGVWDMMRGVRSETPHWVDADDCQVCGTPFFWNWREMWQRKTVGFRQHHCRLCGIAVCQRCSSRSTRLPRLGFERPVRICDGCHTKLFSANDNNANQMVDLSTIIPAVATGGGGRTPANVGALAAAAAAGYRGTSASASSSMSSTVNGGGSSRIISLEKFLEPLAHFEDAKHTVVCTDADESRMRLVTLGTDRTVRLWNVAPAVTASLYKTTG